MAIYNAPPVSKNAASLLHTIHSIIILDNEGRPLISRRYLPLKDQNKDLEKHLWDVTRRKPLGQVAIVDGQLVVYKTNLDIMVYLVSGLEANDLMLGSILDSIYEAMEALIR